MFNTIVLALDGSSSSELAMAQAVDLAKTQGSTIHAVHVVEIVAARGGGPIQIDAREQQEKIERQVKALTDDGVKVQLHVHGAMAGGPAHVIASVAKEVGADLVVSGTRGHTALAGVFLGSVAQRLLSLAQCPVLVVPKAAGAKAAG